MLILLTGLSGSGKSSALKTLEDAGYFAIDNLPGPLLGPLVKLLGRPPLGGPAERVALVMDARDRVFLRNLTASLQILKSSGRPFRILFFDARDEILIRRFSETRRRHPLAPLDRVSQGIQRERILLNPLRGAATQIVDTSNLNVHQLRQRILSFLKGTRLKKELSVTVISFGYRFGLPLEADLVFDVRFLPNPYFVDPLRPLSGRNPKVARFVLRHRTTQLFLKGLLSLTALLLRESLKEGKSYVTLAVGCTGGRHRSVVIASRVASRLKLLGYPVKMQHRDLSRGE